MTTKLTALPIKQLSFFVEDIDAMIRRFPAALEPIFDIESVTIGVACGPVVSRRHVFDFEDGLRITVSRARATCGHVSIGYSARIRPVSQLASDMRNGRLPPSHFLPMATRRFADLLPTGINIVSVLVGYVNPENVNPENVPQFIVTSPADLYELVQDYHDGGGRG